MVPPRTEPAKSRGSPNTVIRATEFMLRWKTWAIGTSFHSGRSARGASLGVRAGLMELHEQPVRQLGGQKGGHRGRPGHEDAAERVIQAPRDGADPEDHAEDGQRGRGRRQEEAERDPPEDQEGKEAHSERGHGQTPRDRGQFVDFNHGRLGALHFRSSPVRMWGGRLRANREPTRRVRGGRRGPLVRGSRQCKERWALSYSLRSEEHTSNSSHLGISYAVF